MTTTYYIVYDEIYNILDTGIADNIDNIINAYTNYYVFYCHKSRDYEEELQNLKRKAEALIRR